MTETSPGVYQCEGPTDGGAGAPYFPAEWNGVNLTIDIQGMINFNFHNPASYGYQCGGVYGPLNPALEGAAPPVTLGAIDQPSRVALVIDAKRPGGGNNCGFLAGWPDSCMVPCTPAERGNDRNSRHNGGINLGFVDGHAKWAKALTLWAYCGTYFEYYEPHDVGLLPELWDWIRSITGE